MAKTGIDIQTATRFCAGAIASAKQFGIDSSVSTDALADLLNGPYATAQAGIDVQKAGVCKAETIEDISLDAIASVIEDNGRTVQ